MIPGEQDLARASDPSIRFRVLVAPTPGRVRFLRGDRRPVAEDFVAARDRVAVVQAGNRLVAVRSRFDGWMKGFLVVDGEPVAAGQPVAWLEVPA